MKLLKQDSASDESFMNQTSEAQTRSPAVQQLECARVGACECVER